MPDDGNMNGFDGYEQARTAPPPPPEPLYVVNPAKWQGMLVPERRWIVPWWIPFGVARG